ncbi:MAG TPA: TIR domain-containing protein [Candidatus Polarisedimenticolaceae bacterium]|nr:TIR domain-containing protein [Candidatus Polarisedimenticolaceae bacterium]
MTPSTPKPRFLIGASPDDRAIAEALRTALADLADVTLWSRGAFEPGLTGSAGLLDAVRGFDFAAFVVAPEGTAPKRATRRGDASDPVALALGICLGSLGRQRTFVVCSAESPLPAELRGVVAATFPPPRSAGIPPAVGCAAAILREQILRLVPAPTAGKAARAGATKPNQVARRRRRPTLGTAYLAGPRRVLKIVDISMTGALLESFGEIPEGQLLDLDLALENGTRIRVSARVARNQHPQWGRSGGVGVAFLRFEGDSREHLAQYIDADPDASTGELHLLADADVPAR